MKERKASPKVQSTEDRPEARYEYQFNPKNSAAFTNTSKGEVRTFMRDSLIYGDTQTYSFEKNADGHYQVKDNRSNFPLKTPRAIEDQFHLWMADDAFTAGKEEPRIPEQTLLQKSKEPTSNPSTPEIMPPGTPTSTSSTPDSLPPLSLLREGYTPSSRMTKTLSNPRIADLRQNSRMSLSETNSPEPTTPASPLTPDSPTPKKSSSKARKPSRLYRPIKIDQEEYDRLETGRKFFIDNLKTKVDELKISPYQIATYHQSSIQNYRQAIWQKADTLKTQKETEYKYVVVDTKEGPQFRMRHGGVHGYLALGCPVLLAGEVTVKFIPGTNQVAGIHINDASGGCNPKDSALLHQGKMIKPTSQQIEDPELVKKIEKSGIVNLALAGFPAGYRFEFASGHVYQTIEKDDKSIKDFLANGKPIAKSEAKFVAAPPSAVVATSSAPVGVSNPPRLDTSKAKPLKSLAERRRLSSFHLTIPSPSPEAVNFPRTPAPTLGAPPAKIISAPTTPASPISPKEGPEASPATTPVAKTESKKKPEPEDRVTEIVLKTMTAALGTATHVLEPHTELFTKPGHKPKSASLVPSPSTSTPTHSKSEFFTKPGHKPKSASIAPSPGTSTPTWRKSGKS